MNVGGFNDDIKFVLVDRGNKEKWNWTVFQIFFSSWWMLVDLAAGCECNVLRRSYKFMLQSKLIWKELGVVWLLRYSDSSKWRILFLILLQVIETEASLVMVFSLGVVGRRGESLRLNLTIKLHPQMKAIWILEDIDIIVCTIYTPVPFTARIHFFYWCFWVFFITGAKCGINESICQNFKFCWVRRY